MTKGKRGGFCLPKTSLTGTNGDKCQALRLLVRLRDERTQCHMFALPHYWHTLRHCGIGWQARCLAGRVRTGRGESLVTNSHRSVQPTRDRFGTRYLSYSFPRLPLFSTGRAPTVPNDARQPVPDSAKVHILTISCPLLQHKHAIVCVCVCVCVFVWLYQSEGLKEIEVVERAHESATTVSVRKRDPFASMRHT